MGSCRPTLIGFLPFSWTFLTELCSFWYGLKDLFLLHKLDEMLKQITSQAVEGMWICTGCYGQFRGKWVKFIVFIFKYIFLISFFSMCRLDQLTHIALWNLKPGNQLNRLYLQWTIEMFLTRWVKESWKIWIINVDMSGQEKWYEILFPNQQANKFQFSLAPT